MGRRQSIGLYSLETFQFLIKIGGKTWKTYKIKHFCLSLNAFDVDILQVCKFRACHKKKIATVATSEGAVLPPTMSGLHPIHQTRQDVISLVMIINIQEDDYSPFSPFFSIDVCNIRLLVSCTQHMCPPPFSL